MTAFEGRDLVCLRGERLVFAGLDFALDAGGALILHGPNGSGKSSLLRLMAGLLAPAEGQLLWGGRPVTEDPEAHRGRLRYLGHLDAVKGVLSAAENLTFWAAAQGGEDGEASNTAAAAEAALVRVGLEALAEVPGRLLSSGQRRRLALARLFLAPAEIWLLDEPTVGLDSESVGRLEAALAEHRQAGGRVAVATHTEIALPGAERLDLAAFAPALEVEAAELASW